MKRKQGWMLAVLLMLVTSVAAQDNKLKRLDRDKWRELVDEVNRKRYDKAEPGQKNPENEYSEYERDLYNDDSYNGSQDYSSTEDEGVYNTSTEDDNAFFDESNDRTGEGDNPWGDGSDVDPRYGDEPNGSGGSQGEGSDRYNHYESRESPVIIDERKAPARETRPGGSGGGDSTWLIIVMIVVLVAAVVYMIMASFSDKNKKVKQVATPEEKLENLTITKSELELALEAALANKNYREAVRIYFIAIIKEMKDHSWIKWEKKKTNYHYINEISGRAQQPDFITATRAFEIVWYGNRSLGENEYRQIEPHFKKLLNSIHS